ncbi:MAG: VCBS repeat-containing protein [Thermoanaerobaculia bacterium]|nr:VCBS repeat-containing protein [Thermoanaerobaculia bacterium]
MTQKTRLVSFALSMMLGLTLLAGCTQPESESNEPPQALEDLSQGLLVSLAALGKTDDGKPKPLPARLGLLTQQGGEWRYEILEDADSNVFHKAMVLDSPDAEPGILTLGGTAAAVKLWRRDGAEWQSETLWQEDFGGRFSRMRDGEVGQLLAGGQPSIAVVTHDQGVVGLLRLEGDGWEVDELDRQADTIVHEVEIGDLDGDGVLEIYATPSARNKLDGTEQPGEITRYVPASGGEREVVAPLGDRHAKEILVTDIDGDGRDELYASVEAVSGGQVEIRRYEAAEGGGVSEGVVIATLADKLSRFLTAGDVDGDGAREIVATGKSSGVWLLRPPASGTEWEKTSIDTDSGGFEHAALLTDLDGDGSDELYVASDDDKEIRRYVWVEGAPVREVIHRWDDDLSRFTWNLMPVPLELTK